MENNSMQQTLVKFYQELNEISLPENAVRVVPRPVSAPAAREDAGTGEDTGTMLDRYTPQVKAADFFQVLRQVAAVIQKHHPHTSADIAQLISALPVAPAAQELLAAKAFTPGTDLMAELQPDLPADTFGLLFNHTVKLFMRQYAAEVLPHCDLEQWLQGRCPVCGSRPSFAVLDRETGKRYLYCGLCEIKWRFRRLGCPYCDSNESQFITVEGMEKYRLYICEECHGYIKTIDEKKTGLEDVNLFWEDINTIHLDLLAMREGYFNNPENNIIQKDF